MFRFLARGCTMWWHAFGERLITLNCHALNVMFMLTIENGSFTYQLKKNHLHLVRYWTLVRFECIGYVCSLLMVLIYFVKKNMWWDLTHMKLISTSTIAACVVDVIDHTTCSRSILKPMYTFFFIHHSSWILLYMQKQKWWLLFTWKTWIQWSHTFVCVCVCNIKVSKNVHMCECA